MSRADDLKAQQAAYDKMKNRPAELREVGDKNQADKTEQWLKDNPRPTA